jgi:two-component system nitrate/nitrite sensor histidine kinase NarX
MTKKQRLSPSESKDLPYQSIFEAANDGVILANSETGLVVEVNPAACMMHGRTREELVGSPLTIFIHPDNQKSFSEKVQQIREGDHLNYLTLDQHRDGSTFHTEWRMTIFNYQGCATLLGIVRDVHKRIQAEQVLNQRIQIRTLEQATLLEISHTLASTLELQPGHILDQLRVIVNYDHAGLFSLEGTSLITLVMRGVRKFEEHPLFRINLNDPGTLTALFNEHRPIRIPDVWSNTPDAQSLRALLDDEAAILIEGMNSWMWVPLVVGGRIIGSVGVAHENRDHFTTHHADLALSVANQAAITMVNAELYGRAQELAVLEERQRMARNLHDAVNQSLFSASLIAEVLPRQWDRDREAARSSLNDLRNLTRGAMAEMRALLAELRPSTLIDAELVDLLQLLANSFTGRTNIPAELKVTGHGTLPSDVQVASYLISREALYNIAKHAEAGKVELILRLEDSAFELKIQDNGRGFDPGTAARGHYGLGMMRERAEAVGAQLSIDSQVGHGTELTICWGAGEKGEAK